MKCLHWEPITSISGNITQPCKHRLSVHISLLSLLAEPRVWLSGNTLSLRNPFAVKYVDRLSRDLKEPRSNTCGSGSIQCLGMLHKRLLMSLRA